MTNTRVSERDGNLPVLAYRSREVCAVLGCGRTWLYEQMNSGRIKSIKIAGRRMIPASAIRQLLGESG